MSAERRRRWLTAISRDDLTDKILEYDHVSGEHFHSGKAAPLWDKWNVNWVPSLKLGHEKLKVSEASVQQSQEKARRATERRKRMVEKDAEINVAEKQPKRNEPGLTVQSLPFDVEMEDIEDIHENLIPDHLKNAASQTDLSCNSILPPEPLHKNMRSSDFDEAFFFLEMMAKLSFTLVCLLLKSCRKSSPLLNLMLTDDEHLFLSFKSFVWCW